MQRPCGTKSNTYRTANAYTARMYREERKSEESRMKLKHEGQPVQGLISPLRMGVSIFSARS